MSAITTSTANVSESHHLRSTTMTMSTLFNSSSGLPPVDYNKLKSFNRKIDDTIAEFVAQGASSNGYKKIKQIQQEVDVYFVSNEKPNTNEYLELMTDICTKLNENPIVEHVNQQFLHKPSQKYSSSTNYITQHLSDLDDMDVMHTDHSFSYRNHQQRYQDLEDLLSQRSTHRKKQNSFAIPPEISLSRGQSKNAEYQQSHHKASTLQGKKVTVKEVLEKVEKLKNEVSELLDERKLLQANDRVVRIDELLEESEQNELTAAEAESIEDFRKKNALLFELVRDETEIINYNLEVLQDQEGWITEKEKGKIKISYQFPDANSMSLKMESELDVPLKNLLCIANEFRYFKEYVPFVKEGYLVKDIRKATKVGYALMDVPMISKRECYFYGAGFNLLDEYGTIPLISKSIHSNLEFCNKLGISVPQQTKHVRLDYKYYVFNIAPLGPNKCHITIVLNVDYKIPFVPKSIQNWCARKFSMILFEKIIKKATNISGSNWEKAMQEDQEFYDWLDLRINGFLKNAGITDDSNSLDVAREKVNAYLAQKKIELSQQQL